MQIQITPDQNFCTFDGQTIFIFVEQDPSYGFNPCKSCVFCGQGEVFKVTEECYQLPCDAIHRSDKNNGFWAICSNVDYQAFTKILKNGG